MRKLQTLVFVVFGFFVTAVSLHAQTYPVQGSAFLIPPYSLRLSDYATSTSERLAMNVLLTDVTRAELRVRFRLHIEGPTISIDTKAEYTGHPVVLQGGVSLRLTNLDLSEYFNLQNIYFTGISEREFLQKGTLPEGLYRICFDVLEYNRGVKISQSICAQAFFVLNDPPIINLPRQGETLRAQMPQNVIMQWTPRHTGSPNSAFNTQYEIKVVEVWPADRNANDAILTQPAIYETTTANTSLIYGPDATQLEPGRTYAFRVRAVPMGVADQLDLFKNNGYSETVSFVYGQACKPPATVTGKVTGPHTLTLDWTQDSNHTAYKVHFRKQGSHDWRLQRANINTADLKDLEANSNYEYEVGAVCGDFESLYSPIGELKTMEAQTPLYECGAQPKGTLNTNQEPLPELKVGDKVHTLTVEVSITKVTGGNGTFSGEAEARMKIFNNALMRLTYKDIRVNKDYWLIGGYFEAVSGGVDLPGDTREGLDVLGDILSESQGGGSSNDYKAPPPDTTIFVAQETITIPDGIQTITKDEKTGLVTVTDTKGVKHDLPQGKDVAVVDENGRGALVDKQGQITNTTAEQAKAAGKREYGFSVVFEKATESKAGFDKYDGKTTALKNTYQKIEEYIVPWKAIATGTDVVKGNLSIGTAKDLIFEQEGARLTYNEFTDILTVNPVSAGSTAQVIVKEKTGDKEKIRGKLNVAGYAPISKTVHIVPVNNATCTISEADLKTYLDNVYGQALVSWQVDKKNKIDVSFTGDFDDGGSGLLSTYTGDMRKVINAYGSMEPEHCYIFLIENGKTKTGYMPRGKRAGFVFLSSQNGEELKHTIAHELGHGAFTLRHPFAEYPTVTEKSTDNLMDYAGGNHLYKWQWDQIHNPVLVLGLFEGDSEGEMRTANIEIIRKEQSRLLGDAKTKTEFYSLLAHLIELKEKLQKLRDKCNSKSYSTYKGNGIIPECFWNNGNNSLYSKYVAYNAGLIDGAYSEAQDLLLLVEGIGNFSSTLALYTTQLLYCNGYEISLAVKDIENIEEDNGIEIEKWQKSLWGLFSDILSIHLIPNSDKPECELFKKTNKQIGDVINLVANLLNVLPPPTDEQKAVVLQIEKYVDEISGNTPESYYLVGKAMIMVASVVVAWEEQVVTKLSKLKEVKELNKLTKWDEVINTAQKARRGETSVGLAGEGVRGAGRFTLQQIDNYVSFATKNKNVNKVMLGKFELNSPTSYNVRAGNDYCYFEMGNKWDEALTSVGNDLDEVWKINKNFIDNQKLLGKSFYLSHNPAIADGFYLREINYLTKPVNQGGLGGTIVNQGDNLWKVIW